MSQEFVDIELEDGWTFRFHFDKREPERLHIEVNGYEIDDALDIFCDGKRPIWNGRRQCYETLRGSRGIWWEWIDEHRKHVRIISVFTRYRY